VSMNPIANSAESGAKREVLRLIARLIGGTTQG
jgi:hypothetical protein